MLQNEQVEKEMKQKLEDHEHRILKLEDNQKEINYNIKQLKTNHEETKIGLLEIRSIVLGESNTQKDLLGKLIDLHFNNKTLELNAQVETKKLRLQIVAILLGSGGAIVAIFQWIVSRL
ncbi:hypothetical protein MOF27_15790 [Priestia megaterium]|uniref:hypothetical protein n=1 Tax=Priestia megaterium TaxID=1404 RepID=UPI00227F08BE|nr:hypothetical protein [Priestia megaterium]MCY9018881.1 hypothetical protein [Priestia megaterium]